MAIPINLLLWGCESWALRVDLSRKLERFVNRKIRKIININLWHVMKHKITVEEMRNRFNNIPSVQTMIDIRTMQFLGKIVRGPVSLPPRQLLIAFVPNCRKRGRPIKCNRETLYESLQRLLQDVIGIHIDQFGSLIDWYFYALDSTFWNNYIEHLRYPSKPAPVRPNISNEPRRSNRNPSKTPRQEPEHEQEPRRRR